MLLEELLKWEFILLIPLFAKVVYIQLSNLRDDNSVICQNSERHYLYCVLEVNKTGQQPFNVHNI